MLRLLESKGRVYVVGAVDGEVFVFERDAELDWIEVADHDAMDANRILEAFYEVPADGEDGKSAKEDETEEKKPRQRRRK